MVCYLRACAKKHNQSLATYGDSNTQNGDVGSLNPAK